MRYARTILKFIFFPFVLLPFLSLCFWCCTTLWSFTDLFPTEMTTKGFLYFFQSGDYKTLLTTTLFSVVVAISSIILSVLAASGLTRLTQSIAVRIEGLLYLPMLLPVVGICMGIHKFFLNVSDVTILNVFIIHLYFSLPYAFMVIYAGYKENGRKWIFIAKNLGITNWKTLLHIELPLIKNYFDSAFLFAFSVSYGQYFINSFLGDYTVVNFSMILAPYLQTSDRNIGAVYIWMFLIVGILVSLSVRGGLKKWKV